MIRVEEYFFNPRTGDMKSCSTLHVEAATALLGRVNALLDEAEEAGGYERLRDPDTDCEISGSRGGNGDGGFRDENSVTGAPRSSHRKARAVDVYDPKGELDAWITEPILERHGLYREHPRYTPGWVHLTDLAPASGRRSFIP